MRHDSSYAPELDQMPAAESGTMRRAVLIQNEDIVPYMSIVQEEVGRMMRRLPRSVQKDDLIAAGSRGLMDALTKNGDAERGAQFEWYARVRIRGAVLDELRSEDWLSRSARAEVTERAAQDQSSTNVVIGFEDMPEHKRLVPVSEDESPLELAERHSQRLALQEAVSELPAREAQIIEMHYFQGIQFKDIAAMMKVSEPRISQLHSRAVGQLRDKLRDEWI